jgi:hypothetical protein
MTPLWAEWLYICTEKSACSDHFRGMIWVDMGRFAIHGNPSINTTININQAAQAIGVSAVTLKDDVQKWFSRPWRTAVAAGTIEA